MTTTMNFFGATTALVLGLLTGSTVQAQSLRHVDELASRLERQIGVVHEEVHAHFRPTSRYVHLDRDVAQMERLADHIHDLVHRGGSVRHMRADVAQLDQLYHHVEELVEFLAQRREIDRRTYTHLQGSLAQVSETLHHLADDLNQLERNNRPQRPTSNFPWHNRPF